MVLIVLELHLNLVSVHFTYLAVIGRLYYEYLKYGRTEKFIDISRNSTQSYLCTDRKIGIRLES